MSYISILTALGLTAFTSIGVSENSFTNGSQLYQAKDADQELVGMISNSLRLMNYPNNISRCSLGRNNYLCFSTDFSWVATVGRDPVRVCVYRGSNLTKESFIGGYFLSGATISSYERCQF